MKLSFLQVLLVIATVLQNVVSQQNSCPGLTVAATSCGVNNCSSLTCQLPDAVRPLTALTFSVEECAGPVYVNLSVSTLPLQRFNRSGSISLGGGRELAVEMSRNATHLRFQVSIVNSSDSSSIPVVPQLLIRLNVSKCMCQSLDTLADNTGHTFFIPECSTNQNCNGVRCSVNIFGEVYYIENVILPCDKAIELVVEDSQTRPLYTTIFNETGRKPIVIRSLPLTVDAVIIPRDYSMDVSAAVIDPLFGRVQIFPFHTIILDRTRCDRPNFTTIAPPPAPTPLPVPENGSSPTCLGFHRAIAGQYRDPFTCRFLDSCEGGISCVLSITATSYTITVQYVDAVQRFVFKMMDRSGMRLVRSNSATVNTSLPVPSDSYVVFYQTRIASLVRGIQIDLHVVYNNRSILDTLLPFSRIPLAAEQCQSLVRAVSDPTTRCLANGDCTGLNCDLDATSVTENDVVFVVDKCTDPVMVNVTVNHGGTSVHPLSQSKAIFLGGSEYLSVEMSRNITDLLFRAYITNSTQSQQQLRPIVPRVTVPLNASSCMCSSLKELALVSGRNVYEPFCNTNENCDGIRCQLRIVGSTFYVEIVVLPCENAIDLRVEDGSFAVLHTTRFTQSGLRTIVIRGISLQVNGTIIARDYSLLIGATVLVPFIGPVEIIPRHVIILDKSRCGNNSQPLPSAPPPTQTTPITPTNPGPTATKTCLAFYDLVRSHLREPFACSFQNSCNVGIRCQLEILDTTYNVTISLSKPQQTQLSLEVRDSGGRLLGKGSSENVRVTLPKPENSNLTLTQSYNSKAATVGLQLNLEVFALSGAPRKDVLISYSEIPVGQEQGTTSKSTTIAVATAVPIVIILVGVVIIIAALVIFGYIRRRGKQRPFGFETMSHTELEEKDLEDYLGTEQGSLPSTRSGVIESNGNDYGDAGEGRHKLQDVDLKEDSDSVKGHLV